MNNASELPPSPPRSRGALTFALVIIGLFFVGLMGLLYYGVSQSDRAGRDALPSPLIGKPAPAFDLPLLQFSANGRAGGALLLSEVVASFGLVAVILMGSRHQAAQVPWMVGLYITAAYWFTASTSFANPAVTIARALTDSFSGIAPGDAPAFILAQLGGAVLAMLFAGWLLGPATMEPSK